MIEILIIPEQCGFRGPYKAHYPHPIFAKLHQIDLGLYRDLSAAATEKLCYFQENSNGKLAVPEYFH